MTTMHELHVVYGSGPVGTAVIEMLLAQGKPVRVVTRSGAHKRLPVQAEVVRGNAARWSHSSSWHTPSHGRWCYWYNFPAFALWVIPQTILFTWIANHTRASVLLAWLFHGAINVAGSQFAVGDPVRQWWLSAAVYGVVALVVLVFAGADLGLRTAARRVEREPAVHVSAEFDDGHMDIDYRYDVSLPKLARACSRLSCVSLNRSARNARHATSYGVVVLQLVRSGTWALAVRLQCSGRYKRTWYLRDGSR